MHMWVHVAEWLFVPLLRAMHYVTVDILNIGDSVTASSGIKYEVHVQVQYGVVKYYTALRELDRFW